MVVVLILEKGRRRYRSVNHPLQEELRVLWTRIRRPIYNRGRTHFGKLETDRTSISISCVTVVSDDDLQSLLL